MTDTRNRKRQENTDLAAPNGRRPTPSPGRNLDEFLRSLEGVLIDITALEVNTMVVERITADKFIAWEAYREIYSISQQYLEQKGIHQSLWHRYLELRKNLKLHYTSLLSNPTSELYNPILLNSATEDSQILPNSTPESPEIPTLLPNPLSPTSPEEILKVQKLLSDSRFLRGLRKISELKAVLDGRNQALLKKQHELPTNVKSDVLQKVVTTDLIYAQTVIQLDGDVLNRYSQEIFDHPQREAILQLHRDGVTASEKQWRGLLEFIIGLVQASLQGGSGKNSSPRGASK